jgi:hypothetical protein
MTQQIVDFKVIKPCKRHPTGALKITVLPGMKKEIREIRRENKGTDRQLLDIFEYQPLQAGVQCQSVYMGNSQR